MKTYLELITVNRVQCDIEFEFKHTESPVDILSVNKIPAIYLSPEFIDDCQFACSNFLIIKETTEEEREEGARGN